MSNREYYKKITPDHLFFDFKLRELWQYKELIGALTRRSFQVRYRQTVLGPAWLLIAPIFSGLITYLVFGKIARMGTGEIPPVLFYLSSNALWAFFSGCLNKNADIFRANAYLFNKVYFPRLAMSASYILSEAIDFAIKMITVFALMVFYIIRGEVHIQPIALLVLPVILLFIGLMAMSIGILISSITVKYRDFQVMLGFVLKLGMAITPIAYPLSEITNPFIRKLFYINPLSGFIELFRLCLFGRGQLMAGSLAWGCVFTLLVTFIGIAVFNKVERNFTDTI